MITGASEDRSIAAGGARTPSPDSDAALAAELAGIVGRALLELRAGYPVPSDRAGVRALKDAGDRAAQDILAARLHRDRPGDAVLSEEAPDSSVRLGARRVWIIDPLDGTEEFGHGRPDFAVHVALWQGQDGLGELTDAAVDVPARGEVWRTDQPRIAAALPTHRPLRIVVSRSRPPVGLAGLLDRVGAELAEAGIASRGIEPANVGSVGAKVGEILAGRAEAYLHPGGLNEWDLAAPLACARSHGLVALGGPHLFNRMPPRCGPVLIAHPAIVDAFAAHWPA